MRKCASFALACLLLTPLAAPAAQTEIIGSYYKTPEQKALECYARGVRAKRKAESEKDSERRSKLYQKAKEELSKSVGYQSHYDGYLALGQVYLAMGQKEAAYDACAQAQALKPGDEAAQGCLAEARKPLDHGNKPGGGE